MGSASSKASPKRFSLRSVAPAIFLALVFIAGAIATLHHNGGGDAVVVVNDRDTTRSLSPPPPQLTRKMLRDDRVGKKQQRRRPAPAKGVADESVAKQRLPRGLAHETTNLEMEASLAGDPRNSASASAAAPAPEAQTKKQKSLLAVPVGIKNKAAVDKLVSKFVAADDQDFAVMLFHYDGAVESWSDLAWSRRAVHVSAPGQTKLWFAKRFLHPDVVAEYEYVFLWDEDLEVDAFDPGRYLAVVRREGLEVSQPALDRASEIHHAHTARSPLAPSPSSPDVHRGAGWVEVMAPVFSRDAWRCAWRMVQNDLIHGWGLDYKLGYCARGDRAVSVGVVDSEYVLHRGVPVLGDGDGKDSGGRAAVRWRSFKEMQIFHKRWEKAAAEDQDWTDPYAAQPPAASSR